MSIMELKIINKKDEPLLSRMMVEADITFEKATPTKEEVKSKLAQVLGKDEKLIVVKGMYNTYGLKKAKSISYLYEDEKLKERIEAKIKKKGKGEPKEKEEEKAAEKKK